ncbi:MAG: tetratricopeptide repeat protein [Saprospiraceae bacterium]|nr:tetratricopeptide repeat protein [Saprospiraceae bacterium]
MATDFDHRTNPNWFLDQLTFYQSANSSPEAIKRNFLVRIAEFEAIIEQLRNKKYPDPVQHELILGRRGSGKSTLLRRIQIEIDEDPGLSEKYIAINLAEEQASIYRLSDLWFEVLEELMIRLGQRKPLDKFSDFPDNQAYTRYLYAQINQLLLAANKKAVLLLDNLDRILENFSDDANLLRETLLNHNDLAIIGGSTRMDEHFWRYDKPFYEFFRRHRLQGLSFGEIHELLNHWAAEMKLPVLHDYALHNRGKVEAIRILTDGLPRALQFFIQILLHDSALYGFDYLRKVMDRATPLYQERLNNLTAPQRKIVQEMAFHGEAISTKLLTEKCRMESKLISSYLKQLDGFGIIETIQTGNKNHLYRIAERFFNMWLIVTQGNPDQKRRAKYLTLFLESFYDGHELVELAKGHIEKLKAGEIGFDKAMVLSKGLVHSRFIGVNERDIIIELTQQLKGFDSHWNELPNKSKVIISEVVKLIQEVKIIEAMDKLEEIENEADGFKFSAKAVCLTQCGKIKEAIQYYEKAIEKDRLDACKNLAILYDQKGDFIQAKKYYAKAIEKGETTSFNNLAFIFLREGREKLAEEILINSLAFGNDGAMLNLASIYHAQNRNPEFANWNIQKYLSIHNSEIRAQELGIVINIWIGHTTNLLLRTRRLLIENDKRDFFAFIYNILGHSQTHLVLSLFHDPELGKDLIAKYELLYYATLILAGETGDNLLLRIPPEVMPTVEQIVAEVREKQAFYAQPPKED